VREWFGQAFAGPTDAQARAWPAIARGENTLLLAPTGSGKTLAAFLMAVDRIVFGSAAVEPGVRVLYISPLKALGADIQRNLKPPIAGVSAVALREGFDFRVPSVGIRSGDTPAAERRELARHPPDILITTPESLFLMLTSQARRTLQRVEVVIVDEIHSLVSGKRGAHLFLSLERLERLRRSGIESPPRLQRIGLSATQRPLAEVARLLGGAEASHDPAVPPRRRPVTVVDAGRRKSLEVRVEVPVEDMAQLGHPVAAPGGPAAAGPTLPSIWPSIIPRLVELIGAHRSTMVFVNSRRLAERMAAAINETAERELAAAHHGSIAKEQRRAIEDRLKCGVLPAIVATSSLELGIDMGAVDLVIQIEAPPTIAAGMQRIGRAGHQVGVPSAGVIFPKYRGDLLACAAATERMLQGEVEETFYPRNPLDVLAQQLVAMVAIEPAAADDLYATVRGAAPFAELPRSAFEGVLDLLCGRYASDAFAELRPRLVWDRITGTVTPRRSAQRLAVLNAGTIPDRGLYGVYLADGGSGSSRVGELDEEMVFETQPGDVFLLGASSWRAVEITHDRVLVAPAPGEPGRMPFWRGDGPGRPPEFGRAIGELTRQLQSMPADQAESRLIREHGLEPGAAKNLLRYLQDQADATGETPSDRTIVVECFRDEVGDWRVVVLSPLGARVHAPWALAVARRLRDRAPGDVDVIWGDDGMAFRLPDSDESPDTELLFPTADQIEDLVTAELGTTALFAGHFRENAARALLLPRRKAGGRTPLWVQRRRAADLLAVASRYPDFPILLETYRQCLRDVFDLPGLRRILADIARRTVRIYRVDSTSPSPFAASVLFAYVANFLYDGDTPLAERRAQALALDHKQLRELLGDAELRELLDADVIEELKSQLQRLDQFGGLKDADAVHEMLQMLGDLSREELLLRRGKPATSQEQIGAWLAELIAARRVIEVRIAGTSRFAAAEDAGRLRDALGVVPPPGLPDAFLRDSADPLADLVARFARGHVPFTVEAVARRFGLGVAQVRDVLGRLAQRDLVIEGEFLSGGRGREWCDVGVLRTIKSRSLARLRRQVEPVEPAALARFLVNWQGVSRPRRGPDALLDVVEQLQGLALPASTLEQEILPARITGYQPGDLDELCAAGEIIWRGCEPLGIRDGRIALYLTDSYPVLASAAEPGDDETDGRMRELLRRGGALFFDQLASELGDFRHDLLATLWRMVWAGEVTNDTLAPLRSLGRDDDRRGRRNRTDRAPLGRRGFRSRRRRRLPGSEGRWSMLPIADTEKPSVAEKQTTLAWQLLERNGVLTREIVTAENVAGGFAGLYPVLRAMEEAGRVRRGYFIAGQGAAQFSLPGVGDRLRENAADDPSPVMLAASDPANPYGAAVRWPEVQEGRGRLQRAAGARVILLEGKLIGYWGRNGQSLTCLLDPMEPRRTREREALVAALKEEANRGHAVFLSKIDGLAPAESDLSAALQSAGFVAYREGFLLRAAPSGGGKRSEQPSDA